MRPSHREAGFTLVELLVVVGLVTVAISTLGTLFLGGPSPAVASAARDIGAVLGEARETAVAYDEATVVFAPAGTGYSARVYRAMPGDAAFQAVNGPAYDSTVAVTESAAPLGSPGFALRVDSRGSVTGYQHYTVGDTAYTMRTCPLSGSFVLALSSGKQQRSVAVPCTLTLAAVTPAPAITAPPGPTLAPYAPGTCPASQTCNASLPPYNATCPPGYTPDATPYVCDSPTPNPTPTPTPDAPTVPPSTATPTSIPTPDLAAQLANTIWNKTTSATCSKLPKGYSECGYSIDISVASFTSATNAASIALANLIVGLPGNFGIFNPGAVAEVLLEGPSSAKYCLSEITGAGDTGASTFGPPGIFYNVSLPEGSGSYKIDIYGMVQEGYYGNGSSTSGKMSGGIIVKSAADDSGSIQLAGPCPTFADVGGSWDASI